MSRVLFPHLPAIRPKRCESDVLTNAVEEEFQASSLALASDGKKYRRFGMECK